jgi:signal peptidase I
LAARRLGVEDWEPHSGVWYARAGVQTFIKVVLGIVLIFGAVLGLLLATCISFWTVPGDDPLLSASIVPTLAQGDLVVLWYRGQPGFGDLARCADPEAQGRYVVGRLMGEEGDEISVDQVLVTVNGKAISSKHSCTNLHQTVHDPQSGDPVELTCEIEEAGGSAYTRSRASRPAFRSPPVHTTVPAASVFLVSDDRFFHDDSRDFGAIPKSSCKERIVFRLWSARGWFDSESRMSVIH